MLLEMSIIMLRDKSEENINMNTLEIKIKHIQHMVYLAVG